MARKVIIDCDPGIDDAIALYLALFDPRLEVVAVTATAGTVSAEQSTRNVQGLIDLIDPQRYPRIGEAVELDEAPSIPFRHIHGSDGLGNASLQVAELCNRHPSEKVLYDEINANPDNVTILAFGPLTNIARVLQRDPEIATKIDQLIIFGGATIGQGNITPAAEFNVFYDPVSASSVFQSPMTKTLVPLDITRQVVLSLGILERLPHEATPIGQCLHRMISSRFRAQRQELGLEGVRLHSVVALLALTEPEMFESVEKACRVETNGNLSTGATVFDEREIPDWRKNMDVVTAIDSEATAEQIMMRLAKAW